MNGYKYIVICASIVTLFGCIKQVSTLPLPAENPYAEGFKINESDQKAIQIADQVMVAQGGRAQWDQTNYIKWNFFGSRIHIWNKKTGDYIIKGLRDSFTIKGNLTSGATHFINKGTIQNHPDTLKTYGAKAVQMWNNDAYWLIMPYKLKDTGVTLTYEGQEPNLSEASAHKLKLTFTNVGDTPDNMYFVYVDPNTYLVNQWDFYPSQSDTTARFQLPWTDYAQYGKIKLSSGRGDQYNITEIAVGDSLSRYFTMPMDNI